MKWIGKRISFIDNKNKTTIIVYPKKNNLVNALMGSWIAMWISIGFIIMWSFITFDFSEQEKIVLIVFMSFWLYFAVKVFRAFLWLIWGKELIKINEVSVSYKKSIRGYGRASIYYIENISKIRLSNIEQSLIESVWDKSPWIKGRYSIEFDYKGKIICFGRKIQSKDAKLLFRLFVKCVNEKVKKLN